MSNKKERGRFTAKRKHAAVLRLIKGESLDEVSRELGVTGARLGAWREAFMASSLSGLRTRQRDSKDEKIADLERTVGKVVMERELLYKKIEVLEEGLPLGRRRSKR